MAGSTLILLAGSLAVAALMFWQFSFTNLTEAEFRRKRGRILWAAALLSVATAYGHMTALEREQPRPNHDLKTFSGPEEPGLSPPPPPPDAPLEPPPVEE